MTKRKKRAEIQCSRCAKTFPAGTAAQVHMAGCRVHSGWSNYETWACALWLDNDEPSYRYWREVARECSEGVQEGVAAFLLADRLKEAHEEAAQERLGERADVFTDLLSAAISEIEWIEIARHILSE